MSLLQEIYKNLVLKHPILVLIVTGLVIGGLSIYTPQIKLDASADSLVLENDDDLKYFQEISLRYRSENFLVITYHPDKDIFSDASLTEINALQQDLETLPGISEVVSILNVPLLNSPPIPLDQLAKTVRTLSTPDIDRDLARQELTTSPLYRELLLSADQDITVLLAYLQKDPIYENLHQQRNTLRNLKYSEEINPEQIATLTIVEAEFRKHQAENAANERQLISEVRTVIDQYRHNNNEIFLGGIPMIIADMIRFIENDLIVFGSAIILFLIIALTTIFRQLRWVILPMLCCSLPTIAMIGLLGLLDWRINCYLGKFHCIIINYLNVYDDPFNCALS